MTRSQALREAQSAANQHGRPYMVWRDDPPGGSGEWCYDIAPPVKGRCNGLGTIIINPENSHSRSKT